MLSFFRVIGALAALLLFAFTNAAEEPLPPEQAFRFSARMLDAQTIVVRYDIVRGYYMYREKFQFAASPVTLSSAVLPPGKLKDDEFFGKVETYRDRVEIKLPFTTSGPVPAELTLQATSQGCADIGICYPPQEQRAVIKTSLSGAVSAAGGGDANPFVNPSSLPAAVGSEELQIQDLLRSAGFWAVVAAFFGFGLGLAFTPCVLPMIPIVSGIVVARGEHLTKLAALALTFVYVIAMAITYAIAGVLAGMSGSMLAGSLQNPWVLGAFAAVFVLLALSMFDLYELQLPSAMQSWFAERSNRMRGHGYLGVFVMGVFSALIIGPCVAPPLAGALLFIAERGDVVLGGSALFAMALGMGTPLIAVGVSAGSLLPKAGAWMQSVKRLFGALLLAVAIWIVSPVIPIVVQMAAWGVLLVVSAIFLRAIDPLPHTASGFERFAKGIGVVALLAGASLLIGALGGGRDILQPLAGLRGAAAGGEMPGADASTVKPTFERVADIGELDARLAASGGKPILLDFYADWCVSCKEMERFTFSDEAVRARMANFVLLKADVTANNEADKALLKRFSLFGPPGIIFFAPNGREVKGLRVIGFQPAKRFAATLDLLLQPN
jgi:thiol:disulfide interchange protein DsbD